MPLIVIAAPIGEPITVEDVKAYLKIEESAGDESIRLMIQAAREYAEGYMMRQILTATLELAIDDFKNTIELPMPPLQSVTSVKYIDSAGAEQTVDSADYLVDTDSEPGRIQIGYGKSWPVARNQINAVRIRYTAGYADADSVPPSIKQYIIVRVGGLYEAREGLSPGLDVKEIPRSYLDGILDPHRIIRIP